MPSQPVPDQPFTQVAEGVYCIDTVYTAPDVACCYLLVSEGEGALIETGTARSVPRILETLDVLQLHPSQIRHVIPTHVHLDHAGGAGQLMQHLPDARLLIHPRGARHMADPTRLIASSEAVYGAEVFARLYGTIIAIPEARIDVLDDGATICCGDRVLEVLHTRGHADHHLCLFDRSSRGWFTGDMFGISYPHLRFADAAYLMPATTPTQFDPQRYAASVMALADRQPRTMFLTHFGALPFAVEQVAQLARQLDAYASAGAARGEDREALEQDILSITEDELRACGAQEARELAESLSMDVRLNAQGVAWWSQRQSS